MSHPFEKMFYKALKKSSPEYNEVLFEAEKLLEKGYSPEEIYKVLDKLHRSLIESKDIAVLAEAVEEFQNYVDLDD
jgi:hypothetical protein